MRPPIHRPLKFTRKTWALPTARSNGRLIPIVLARIRHPLHFTLHFPFPTFEFPSLLLLGEYIVIGPRCFHKGDGLF
jgi:hypothetical protein